MRALHEDTFREATELITFTDEMFELAQSHLAEEVVAPNYLVDANYLAH
ncbi:MAG: hypothetical protein H0X40_00595 [Chthoniobacterales bacterium]|nr:hypothetical protein [Chthoniobacterales bacterium]